MPTLTPLSHSVRRLLLVTAVLPLVLSACGGGKDSSSPQPTATADPLQLARTACSAFDSAWEQVKTLIDYQGTLTALTDMQSKADQAAQADPRWTELASGAAEMVGGYQGIRFTVEAKSRRELTTADYDALASNPANVRLANGTGAIQRQCRIARA